MPLLAPETLDFGNGQAGDAHLGQRFPDLIQLERLDDRLDFFHACLLKMLGRT